MKIEKIAEKDGMLLYTVTPAGQELLVGDTFSVTRAAAEVGEATTAGVLVKGKMLDRAPAGQICQVLLRGGKFAVGDELSPA